MIATFAAIDLFAALLCAWAIADRDTYRPAHRKSLRGNR